MNLENLDYLKNSLKYLGFGEHFGLQEELEKEIRAESKAFNLLAEVFIDETCKLEALLYFRRSDQQDMYFFNKYDASLRYPDNKEKERAQTFYINRGTGITLREAFNLLQGRSVNKDLTDLEGDRYNAWLQLNFDEKDAHGNYKMRYYRVQYGYDLEKTLQNYPIREMQNDMLKAALLQSLKKGNMHPVSFVRDAKTETRFIEASPRFKSINIIHTSSSTIPKIFFKKGLYSSHNLQADTLMPTDTKWDDQNEENEDTKEEESKPARRRLPGKKIDRVPVDNKLLLGHQGAVN